MDGTWTIGELAERAAAALAADGAVQLSGRVRDLPNTRLIRWYTTIGLLDPPLGRRGRVALYGPRHLLQLVAVKRRQAEGRSIAEIQLELAAATKETLARIAALPPVTENTVTSADPPPPTQRRATAPARKSATGPGRSAEGTDATGTDGAPAQARSDAATDDPGMAVEAADSVGAPAGPAGERVRERSEFWRVRPDVSYGPATVAADYGRPLPPVVQGVRLAPGLTLVLDGPALSDDDLAAIDAAARPLLDELRRRGLLTPGDSPAGSPVELPVESPARPPADHFRRSP